MKKIIHFFFIICSIALYAQEKKITKTGNVVFEANSSNAPEEIKAKNETAVCVLNSKTGEIASIVLMKAFKFKVALMQEHFNENYVESDKYPKSTFSGKIENFDPNNITTKETKCIINGILQIHGVTKNISIPATIKKTSSGINVNSKFDVKLEDFKIEVPSIVGYKLAKSINILFNFDLI